MFRIFLLSIGICIISIFSSTINGQGFQFFISGLIYFYFSSFQKSRSNINSSILFLIIASPFMLSYGADTFINKTLNGIPIVFNILISCFIGIVSSRNKKMSTYFFLYLLIGTFFVMPNYLSFVHEHNSSEEKELKALDVIMLPDSSKISIDTIRNKVMVLSFWHSKCGECFEEFKNLDLLHEKFKSDNNVIIQAVNLPIKGDNTSHLDKIISKYIINKKYSFPLALSLKNFEEVADIVGFSGVPTIIIIDKKGKIKYTGFIYTNSMVFVNNSKRIIRRLLKE